MDTTTVFRILVINPGSTSTKLGIFENEKCLCDKTLRHSSTELERFDKVWDQYEFRKKEILNFLQADGYDLGTFHCVVGRGGMLKPIESGTYRVDERMIADLRIGVQGQHASNLGGVLAYGIGWDYSIPSYIVDPVCVDEYEPISRISGMADIPRTCLVHALNIKAVARKAARDFQRRLEDLNLIVAHLGGGITVAALRKGRIIDVNNGLSEGPFSPERSGSVPLIPLVEMCFSGKYDKKTVLRKIVGGGGLVSHLGTNSAGEVETLIRAGNARAKLVYEAMAYRVAIEIGARAVALNGQIDGILLTGGLAHSVMLTTWIEERCRFLGTIHRYPGEDELGALAAGAMRVLRGEEMAKIYDARKKTIGIFFFDHLIEYDVAIKILENKLRDLGYRFRQNEENLEIVIRNCHSSSAKMQEAIEEFSKRKVDLIVSMGSPAAAATKLSLKGLETPVVCMATFDPVVMGLAQSYAGSGNNIAGNCYRVSVLDQIKNGLVGLIPNLRRLGAIYKAGELQSEIQLDELVEAAGKLGMETTTFDCQSPADIASATTFFLEKKVQAVFLASDTTSATAGEKDLAPLIHALPTLCPLESIINKGGLVGRVADWEKFCDKAAEIAINLLEGASPASIPIYKHPEAKTVLNLLTAKALGLLPAEEFLQSVEVKPISEKGTKGT